MAFLVSTRETKIMKFLEWFRIQLLAVLGWPRSRTQWDINRSLIILQGDWSLRPWLYLKTKLLLKILRRRPNVFYANLNLIWTLKGMVYTRDLRAASSTDRSVNPLRWKSSKIFYFRETFLAHVITNHKLVIGEVELISDLTSYVAYWRARFINCKDLSRYCTIIKGW